jgi:valyl-tRNA synthetase
LRLWHPYIPFVTEELYQKIGFSGMLIEAPWSKVAIKRNEKIEQEKEIMMDLLREIRSIKAENDVPNSGTIKLYLYAKGKNLEIIEKSKDIISGIVKSEYTEIITSKKEDENLVYGIIKAGIEFYIDISNAVDREKERERLDLQIIDMREYIAILDKKLLNECFVRKAPQSLVREEMEKKRLAQEKLKKLEEKMESIS